MRPNQAPTLPLLIAACSSHPVDLDHSTLTPSADQTSDFVYWTDVASVDGILGLHLHRLCKVSAVSDGRVT